MITANNLKSVFDAFTQDDVKLLQESRGDYFAIYTTGNFGAVILESFDYANDDEAEIYSTGGVISDYEGLMQLFVESESVNPYLIELI